ncbi:acyclic terpene utilization AtuA family protein [Oceanibacterium hippocampi]|uniref:Terpene utilization protein AtuA n=1 Tax=Oceanibacterium hippocampi TaxID=745714 RepID=A0A1Y5RE85_9PROT|nr:acyclic terpene utilization AtuA family protein [Oceanibacterium hippocampi]SLN12633.1 hypothetical protein OCH7691_00178 [Oceanibacterium hippocampi]
MTAERIVRIGGASGFWGDSAVGAPQLVRRGEVDYLVFDYLAELTMSILARMRAKSPDQGYAVDFVNVAMRSVLREVASAGIRVLSNAGGVNPRACGAALAALARELGVDLRIAVVEGDDVMPLLPELRDGIAEMATGAPLPDAVISANAYLGALPVARALAEGAQVVITGRSVDSALTLGALIHEFGWAADDYDRLAAGSLAGHILECGCQATGGLHTDWEQVEGWEDIGYPIAECRADGRFVVTKPAGTGGLVTPAVVAEQMLYEVGDPGAYILPDVVCDFRAVTMEQAGADRVLVAGARGLPPTATYKVSATYLDGYRATAQLTILGIDAVRKAERTATAILDRTRALFRTLNLGDYSASHVEILGGEAAYGPHSRARDARECVMWLAVTHDDRQALELFVREIAPAGTSWSPGTTGAGGGRPKVQPVVRLFSFLLDKATIAVTVTMDGGGYPVALPVAGGSAMARPADIPVVTPRAAGKGPTVTVPLIALAWARSGDKGDSANIGVIARRPEFLPLLKRELTAARVAAYFAHLVAGDVERFDVPGVHGLNFLMQGALGGGGMASLRNDPLGKGLAQMLLDIPVSVPADWPARYTLERDRASAV